MKIESKDMPLVLLIAGVFIFFMLGMAGTVAIEIAKVWPCD